VGSSARIRDGSFTRAVETIRMLSAAKWMQKMDVVSCIHKRNLAELDDVRRNLIPHHRNDA